jgi:antitoxin PrlF
MTTTTVSSTAQITHPEECQAVTERQRGDRTELVEIEPDKVHFVAATRCVTDLKGMFGKLNKVVTIEDMNSLTRRY